VIDSITNIRFTYRSIAITLRTEKPEGEIEPPAGINKSTWYSSGLARADAARNRVVSTEQRGQFGRSRPEWRSVMTSLAIGSPSPLWERVVTRANAIFTQSQKVLRAWINRRAAAQLGAFDDRMLADIGLSRSDLNDAFSEPLWRDPTVLLVSRVHERRAHRRRAIGFDGNLMIAPPLAPESDGTGAAKAVADEESNAH
jgi:uncharacterized protein YjiS (DUF1127 family)